MSGWLWALLAVLWVPPLIIIGIVLWKGWKND